MANCSEQTGFLFWKKPCVHPSLGNCAHCRKFLCQLHAVPQDDGTVLCRACAPQEESDTVSDSGSGFSFSWGGSSSEGSSESIASGGDSGGGDSGGGGDGGGGGD